MRGDPLAAGRPLWLGAHAESSPRNVSNCEAAASSGGLRFLSTSSSVPLSLVDSVSQPPLAALLSNRKHRLNRFQGVAYDGNIILIHRSRSRHPTVATTALTNAVAVLCSETCAPISTAGAISDAFAGPQNSL